MHRSIWCGNHAELGVNGRLLRCTRERCGRAMIQSCPPACRSYHFGQRTLTNSAIGEARERRRARNGWHKSPKVTDLILKTTKPRHNATPAQDWLRVLNGYRAPSHVRSLIEILITAGPFVLLWITAWICLRWSYLLSLVIAVPAAGFLVRLFMIQHDCGHGAFFRRRLANDWVGRAISVLTLTPYDHWRHTHAIHHASSGNSNVAAWATSPR